MSACSNNAANPGTNTSPTNTGTTTAPVAGSPTTPAAAGGSTATAGSTVPKAGTTGTTTATGGTPATTAGGSVATATAGTGGSTTTPAAGMSGGTAGGGAAPGGTGFKACGKPAKEGMCKSNGPGVYAMKVDVDVWYMDEVAQASGGLALFDAGRGPLTIYFRNTVTDVCEDGSSATVLAHPCGSRIPGLYQGLLSKVFQIVFPDDLWDKPGVPDYMTTGSTTGFDAGSILKIDKAVGLLGVNLTAADAPWPTYEQTPTFSCGNGKTGEACFVDVDGDGRPGFAVKIQTDGTPASPGYGSGWAFAPAPTDAGAAIAGTGTTSVDIGLRTRVGGSGAIGADCKSGMGDADADDFESRVNSCTKTDGTKCSDMEASFVDQNTPAFHVLKAGAMPPAAWMSQYQGMNKAASTGPKSTVIRLGNVGETFTCDKIRAAFPAQ